MFLKKYSNRQWLLLGGVYREPRVRAIGARSSLEQVNIKVFPIFQNKSKSGENVSSSSCSISSNKGKTESLDGEATLALTLVGLRRNVLQRFFSIFFNFSKRLATMYAEKQGEKPNPKNIGNHYCCLFSGPLSGLAKPSHSS